mmetsp:Transcript_24054/g.55560  ORF Transcript_24054/g.55560 Transcript_24054/m.55560 type:complete len:104 (-) Transcript_24054:595-906(-)
MGTLERRCTCGCMCIGATGIGVWLTAFGTPTKFNDTTGACLAASQLPARGIIGGMGDKGGTGVPSSPAARGVKVDWLSGGGAEATDGLVQCDIALGTDEGGGG